MLMETMMMPQQPQYLTDTKLITSITSTIKPMMIQLNTESKPCKASHKHSTISSDKFNLQLLLRINPSLSSCQSSPLSSSSSSLLKSSNSNALTCQLDHRLKMFWPLNFRSNNFTNSHNNQRFKRQNAAASSSFLPLPFLSSSSSLISSNQQVLTPAITISNRLLQINRDFARIFPTLYKSLMRHYTNYKLIELNINTPTATFEMNNNDNAYAYKEIENDKEFHRFLEKILNDQNLWDYLKDQQPQTQSQQQHELQNKLRNKNYENVNYVKDKGTIRNESRQFGKISENDNFTFCLKQLIENEIFWQILDDELDKYRQQQQQQQQQQQKQQQVNDFNGNEVKQSQLN